VADLRKTFNRLNLRKTPGLDGIPGHVLRACADQLVGMFTDIFNPFLSQSVVPSCLKMATIAPVLKTVKVTELTSVTMKCLERLVKDHINSPLPTTESHCNLHTAPIEPQMTQKPSHCTLSYPVWTTLRMWFIDYSSLFNIL
jgi:hypothetical protein